MKGRALAAVLIAVISVLALSACGDGVQARTPWDAEGGIPYVPGLTREVEISYFGRQVAEEFLEQFDSLFICLGYYGDMFHPEWWDNAFVFIDRYGNEVVDEVPFIRASGLASAGFIANDFWLYDLNHNGIPDIVISFMSTTWRFSSFYRFLDGRFEEISFNAGIHGFFYDEDGRMLVLSNGRLLYFDDDSNLVYFDDVLRSNWYREFAEQGFTQIPYLAGLTENIRQSITERLFADTNNLPATHRRH